MQESEEIWKDVVGYEGFYQVSSKGAVKSIFEIKRTYRSCRLLTLWKTKKGYFRVGLVKEGKQKMFLTHRLVADAFIPNPENKRCVNHIDFNTTNNCVENLNWMTHKENSLHSIEAVRLATRYARTFIKRKLIPVIMMDINGSYIREYSSSIEATKDIKGHSSNRMIRKHLLYPDKVPLAYGYRWAFKVV